jgi:serine/threonine protein kinase
MIKKCKKGGSVLASGGYGCVFSPALLCNKTKKRRKNHISKLMSIQFANQEYNEINNLKKSLQHIKQYNNYFLLDGITMCKPAKLTDQDLQYFEKKCTALPKDGLSVKNLNDNIDKLMTITMPNAGLPIDDYIVDKKNFGSISKMSIRLIDLLKNGIVPMNNKNIYHNDIKDSNILVDDTGSKMYTRLIDWGLTATYIPFVKNPFPLAWYNRPFQYNNPFSIIMFSPIFIVKYNDFLHKVNQQINPENINSFVDKYIDFWMLERGRGHYALICKIISIISNEPPKQYIVNYIAEILLQFTQINNGELLAHRDYLDTVFIHNVDKWGFVTSYFPMLNLYHTNVKILDPTDVKCFGVLKELFNYTYKSATQKLSAETIIRYLHTFNATIKTSERKLDAAKGVKQLTFSSSPTGITGKTIELDRKTSKRSSTRRRRTSKQTSY